VQQLIDASRAARLAGVPHERSSARSWRTACRPAKGSANSGAWSTRTQVAANRFDIPCLLSLTLAPTGSIDEGSGTDVRHHDRLR
jgi:hypothetical protein